MSMSMYIQSFTAGRALCACGKRALRKIVKNRYPVLVRYHGITRGLQLASLAPLHLYDQGYKA